MGNVVSAEAQQTPGQRENGAVRSHGLCTCTSSLTLSGRVDAVPAPCAETVEIEENPVFPAKAMLCPRRSSAASRLHAALTLTSPVARRASRRLAPRESMQQTN